MNGCQFAWFTYMNPNPITRSTIVILRMTMKLLKRADSLMPMTRSVVISAISTIAGRLITAPVCENPAGWMTAFVTESIAAASWYCKGALVKVAGEMNPRCVIQGREDSFHSPPPGGEPEKEDGDKAHP